MAYYTLGVTLLRGKGYAIEEHRAGGTITPGPLGGRSLHAALCAVECGRHGVRPLQSELERLEMLDLDKAALVWINSHHYPVLDWILGPIAYAGDLAAIWIAVFLGMMIFGKAEHRKIALTFMLTIIVVDRVISPYLNHAFFRERPYAAIEGIRQMGIRWSGGSFPSGHAHSVWIAAIILAERWRKLTVPLVVFAVLTCYSRPYCGMHYPLDVIAGSALGIAAGFIVIGTRRLMGRKRSAESQSER